MLFENVMLMYLATLFIMLLSGMLLYMAMNGTHKNMGIVFGELFICCWLFLILPPLLGVTNVATVEMYMLGILILIAEATIVKFTLDNPGMMILVQVFSAAVMFIPFSALWGITG